MSSTNEELPPPPKPRISPLEFRNTDLVSRLLAATPPYLYNMPMVPNSYFFSEMLRSFVQAKTDATSRSSSTGIHHRRPRKRSWTQARAEYYQKASPKSEKHESPPLSWLPKSTSTEKPMHYDCNKRTEKPLELTMGKMPLTNNMMNEIEPNQDPKFLHTKTDSKPDLENHMQMMYPTMAHGQESNSNLILPPPPPIWYPPLYPTPYGIDPLHFFIDLRVSGHIYDRKNQSPQTSGPPIVPPSSRESTIPEPAQNSFSLDTIHDTFKQPRHASAFSVPIPTSNKNIPMNLTKLPQIGVFTETKSENRECTKFDVKSMGFDKNSNKTSTNYVMNNIGKIYNDIHGDMIKTEDRNGDQIVSEPNEKESEEEKQKRVKDLRALIGLELVVDYMNHAKPGRAQQNSEESSTDVESSGSPAVEVVALQDVDQEM